MVVRDPKRGELTFVCSSKARSVYLAGSFNDWDPSQKRMVRSRDGSFRARMKLPPGTYEYKFIVDGQWADDPDAEDQSRNPFGSTNSLVTV